MTQGGIAGRVHSQTLGIMNMLIPQKWLEGFLMMFSAKIDAEINLDSFTFIKDHHFKKFQTFIYVSNNTDQPQIVSVGKTPAKHGQALKVSIFEKSKNDTIFENKYDYLAAFLMHCLRSITPKYAMVRPSIYLSGAKNLEPVLNGFQNKVLIQAFGEAVRLAS